ncbi:MAG: hypothetical protein AAGJ82_14225 [Bacteroidota bacterium]
MRFVLLSFSFQLVLSVTLHGQFSRGTFQLSGELTGRRDILDETIYNGYNISPSLDFFVLPQISIGASRQHDYRLQPSVAGPIFDERWQFRARYYHTTPSARGTWFTGPFVERASRVLRSTSSFLSRIRCGSAAQIQLLQECCNRIGN